MKTNTFGTLTAEQRAKISVVAEMRLRTFDSIYREIASKGIGRKLSPGPFLLADIMAGYYPWDGNFESDLVFAERLSGKTVETGRIPTERTYYTNFNGPKEYPDMYDTTRGWQNE